MRQKITYIANDGTEFNSREECMSYEVKAIDIKKLIEATKTIYDICNAFDCGDCPLRRVDRNTCRFNESHFSSSPSEAWDFEDM